MSAGSRDSRRRSGRTGTGEPDGIGRAEHELLRFAIIWLPYGCGPDDDILINFGLTRQSYLDRLREVIGRSKNRIHPGTAARLLRMCETYQRGEHTGASHGLDNARDSGR